MRRHSSSVTASAFSMAPAAVALAGVALAANCNFFFPFNADQACESEIRALCHFAYSCCNSSERDALVGALGVAGFRNEGECVNERLEDGSAACGNSLAVQDAINQNRFEYDGALAEKCLKPQVDALNQCEAAKVFQPDDLGDECANLGFFNGNFAFGKGKVKAGKGCFQDFECADAGSDCKVNADDDPNDDQVLVTAAGVCQAPAKEGEDCSADTGSDGLCEPGTFCGVDLTCQKNELLQNGQACQQDFQCESQFCDDIAGANGATCADKLNVGDECLDNQDCDTGLCGIVDGGLQCQDQPKLVIDGCNGLQGDDTKF